MYVLYLLLYTVYCLLSTSSRLQLSTSPFLKHDRSVNRAIDVLYICNDWDGALEHPFVPLWPLVVKSGEEPSYSIVSISIVSV